MFYVYRPKEPPKGTLVRFKTLGEARDYMRANPGAMRVYFHDIGALNINEAIDIESVSWPEEPKPICRAGK